MLDPRVNHRLICEDCGAALSAAGSSPVCQACGIARGFVLLGERIRLFRLRARQMAESGPPTTT